MEIFWIVLKKRSPEKILGRKSQVFLVNTHVSKKTGHWEFGVPGNVIYKKSPGSNSSSKNIIMVTITRIVTITRRIVTITRIVTTTRIVTLTMYIRSKCLRRKTMDDPTCQRC